MHNAESVLENKTHKIWGDFEIQTDLIIPARQPDLVIVNNNKKKKRKEKKRTCRIVDFAVPTDHRVKLEESEKREKYVNIARELKKLWNMTVTVTPVVNGALSIVTKGTVLGLEDLEIRGRVKTIQTTAFFRSARILRRVQETLEDLLSI